MKKQTSDRLAFLYIMKKQWEDLDDEIEKLKKQYKAAQESKISYEACNCENIEK
jgi:alpha-amylase/alpha-mannosidase (GH57 family)